MLSPYKLTRRPRAWGMRLLDRAAERAVERAVERAGRVETERREQESTPQLQPGPAEINRAYTADLFFGAGGRYGRTLVPERVAKLVAEIKRLTGHHDPGVAVQQAFRAVLAAETVGLGRIAGSNYNIIGKLVVPPLLSPPAGPVLEIGTLFALFSPALIRQFRRLGEVRHLTLLDPLEGIQIQPGMAARQDPTGTPVTAEVARYNLLHSGLAADEFRIVTGFSSDQVARSEVADRSYAVVIVDGDHSEDGVYDDLWWVQDLVLPGAIVVMDDFGDPKWPGVERATRRYLAGGGRLQLLGTAATSAYLRMP